MPPIVDSSESVSALNSIRAAQQLGSQALFEAAARVSRHHIMKLDSRMRRMQSAHEQGQLMLNGSRSGSASRA